MVGCLPPFFPFSSFLPFLLRLSSICVTLPYIFPVYAPQTLDWIIPSVFLIPLCPSSEALWITNPTPPHPPNPYLAHGYRHQTHIMHCPQLSSPPPLIVAFACLQRDSWIFEPILNLWPAGLKKRTVGSVCVCVYQAGGNRWWGHREGVDG